MTIVEEIDKKSGRPHRSKNIQDAIDYLAGATGGSQNISKAVKGLDIGGGSGKNIWTEYFRVKANLVATNEPVILQSNPDGSKTWACNLYNGTIGDGETYFSMAMSSSNHYTAYSQSVDGLRTFDGETSSSLTSGCYMTLKNAQGDSKSIYIFANGVWCSGYTKDESTIPTTVSELVSAIGDSLEIVGGLADYSKLFD